MPWLRNKKPKRKRPFNFTPNPFYRSSIWKKTRDGYIKAHTRCEITEDGKACGMAGYSVDHIYPIRLGGSSTSWNNLQTSCKRHQFKKSAADAREHRKEYLKLRRK